jgi:hypothetical protein
VDGRFAPLLNAWRVRPVIQKGLQRSASRPMFFAKEESLDDDHHHGL